MRQTQCHVTAADLPADLLRLGVVRGDVLFIP